MNHGRFRGKRNVYCGRTRRSKIRYRTLKDAKKARASAINQRPDSPLRIYRCPDCEGYHLTHWSERLSGNPHTAWKSPDHTVSSENT